MQIIPAIFAGLVIREGFGKIFAISVKLFQSKIWI